MILTAIAPFLMLAPVSVRASYPPKEIISECRVIMQNGDVENIHLIFRRNGRDKISYIMTYAAEIKTDGKIQELRGFSKSESTLFFNDIYYSGAEIGIRLKQPDGTQLTVRLDLENTNSHFSKEDGKDNTVIIISRLTKKYMPDSEDYRRYLYNRHLFTGVCDSSVIPDGPEKP